MLAKQLLLKIASIILITSNTLYAEKTEIVKKLATEANSETTRALITSLKPKNSDPLAQNTQSKQLNQSSNEIKNALNAQPNRENGKQLFQICALCHTNEGWGSSLGRFPQISHQHASVIIKQLADIRAGNRDNPTMYPFTQSKIFNTYQDIADVSAYIASLPMTRNNGKGPGFDLQHGKKVYKENCVECHGNRGEGDAKKFYPRIQGQHFNYLVRQMIWIKSGKRRNANPDMVEQIHSFTLKDITAVADYISRIKPEESITAPEGWLNSDFKFPAISAPKVQNNNLQSID